MLLALDAARVPTGPDRLVAAGVEAAVASLARWLPGASAAPAPDAAAAHRAWCSLLTLAGAASAAHGPGAGAAARAVLAAAGPHVDAALAPLGGQQVAGLTLPSAREAAAAAAVLRGAARGRGAWEAALPGAPAAARRAAARLIEALAAPGAVTPSCAADEASARTPARLALHGGWFAAPSSGRGPHREGDRAPPPPNALAFAVAERAYVAAGRAASFLAASAPTVDEDEAAAGLDATWPSGRALAALLSSCADAAACLPGRDGRAPARAEAADAARAARALAGALRGVAALAAAAGAPLAGADRAASAAAAARCAEARGLEKGGG
jgi:hypothetical protein